LERQHHLMRLLISARGIAPTTSLGWWSRQGVSSDMGRKNPGSSWSQSLVNNRIWWIDSPTRKSLPSEIIRMDDCTCCNLATSSNPYYKSLVWMYLHTIICLDTSILAESNIDQREYPFFFLVQPWTRSDMLCY
jgi:hypothetical protein